jgi:UTP-glucose-1-phosphate uridylyltransferase
MSTRITKAVFPVAGMGTRFLPATKANPKEMLPIVDKPLIQYAAEEAIAAGITQLIFVTSSTKRAIEDHFDKNYELETELALRGKHDLLNWCMMCCRRAFPAPTYASPKRSVSGTPCSAPSPWSAMNPSP